MENRIARKMNCYYLLMVRTVPGTQRTGTKMIIVILERENGRKRITKEIIQENFSELKHTSINNEQTTRELNTINEAYHHKISELQEQEKKLQREKTGFVPRIKKQNATGLLNSNNGSQMVMARIPSRF